MSKSTKGIDKRQKQVCVNEKGNRSCNNGENKSDQKIYASMAHMSDNDECPGGSFGDSLKLTNWILDSGETCHMTTKVSYFIPVLLEDTDKNIKV